MTNKSRFIVLFSLLTFLLFVFAGCSSTDHTENYNMNLKVAGEGSIQNENDQEITSDQRTFTVTPNSSLDLKAVAGQGTEFLFWAGDANYISEPEQKILMDRDKDIISVFGAPEDIFMAGYVSESWQNLNVIGYWKALIEDPKLEIFVRETDSDRQAVRLIFDQGDDYPGEVVFYSPESDGSPDLVDYEFIAAVTRIEESNVLDYGEEASRYVFVYIDRQGFDALVLADESPNHGTYDDIISLKEDGDQVEFGRAVENLILENREEDIIIGNTVNIFEY